MSLADLEPRHVDAVLCQLRAISEFFEIYCEELLAVDLRDLIVKVEKARSRPRRGRGA
jgi:hypothetical protein